MVWGECLHPSQLDSVFTAEQEVFRLLASVFPMTDALIALVAVDLLKT